MIKKFKDIIIKQEDDYLYSSLVGRLFFNNSFGVNIVRRKLKSDGSYASYTNNELQWEVAVIYSKNKKSDYFDIIDVNGYLYKENIDELMINLQTLNCDEIIAKPISERTNYEALYMKLQNFQCGMCGCVLEEDDHEFDEDHPYIGINKMKAYIGYTCPKCDYEVRR